MKYFGHLIAGLSGSMGGVTGSRNKGGSYIRVRAVPTNPNSGRQQTTRTQFGSYASRWSTVLTQAQRDLWNTYAQNHTIEDKIGAQIYINGICWYIMFNTRLVDAGIAPIPSPPPGAAPTGFSTFTCDISALNTVDLTFAPAILGTDCIQLWQTLPGTSGQTPNFKQARLVGYSPQGQASPWAATLPFGVASAEQATFYGAVMNYYGQISVHEQHTDLADY